MAKLVGTSTISYLDLYASTTEVPGPLYVGFLHNGENGKLFRYSKAGASALIKGNLLQESVEDTSYENMAIGTAAVIGDAFLQVTNGTATITSEQFIGGSIGVYTAGGVAIGDEYTITGVSGTLTTGGALKVYTDRAVRYAYTTAATVVMKRSPWSGVIQQPATTPTGMTVGVAIYEIPAASYGFVQSHGVVTALSDGSTFAVGSDLGNASGTAGAVTVYAAGTTRQKIGVSREAAASAKGISIFLSID